jgi:hypothetical protein
MTVMLARCAGLDVHQKTVVACVLSGAAVRRGQPEAPHVQHRHLRQVEVGRLAGGTWSNSRGY